MTEEQEDEIMNLREEGVSWKEVAKRTGIPRSTCQGVVKRLTSRATGLEVRDARILKPCPNPRILIIYFGDRKDGDMAKMVTKPWLNNRPGARVKVVKVEGEDGLYRLAD